jgi:hypothetical protein
MTRIRALLVVAAALAANPALAARPDRTKGVGEVEYATATRAYLDVGRADGLVEDAVVTLRRAGQPPTRCTVDLVSDNHASCAAEGARAGDDVRFELGPLPPEPKTLPPPPSDDELARRAAALETAPPSPLVAYRGPAAAARPVELRRTRGLSAAIGYAAWSSTSDPTFGVASVVVGIHDAEVGGGVTVDVAARAERWVPDATEQRFRPDTDTRLEVWQAQLTAPVSRVRIEAGRVLPAAIPGATVFDGASAGYRVSDGLELGVFGGAVPEPDTLGFTTRRSTGGAFWVYERRSPGGAGLRQEGRVAAVQSPELGTRVEASLAAGAWWKSAYLSGEAHFGVGGEAQAAGALDAARIDYTQRLGPVSLGAGYRHAGLDVPGAEIEVSRFPGRTEAADAWLGWDVFSHLRIGASGGFSRDPSTGLDRQWLGPELGVPRVWGGRLGFSAGYLEERGWIEGRSAWAQILYRAGERFRLITRGTWSHQVGAGVDTDEAGLLASAGADLGGGFWLRASLLARMPIVSSEGSSPPLGLTGSATLGAAY